MSLDSLTQAWRHRATQREQRLSERRRVVRDRAASVASTLRNEFGATDVWLFGSHAWGRSHERSDIDVAVASVPPVRFFEALARVAEVAGEQIDLVPLEECAPSLRDRILREGIRL